MLTNPGVHLSNSGVQPPAKGVHRAAAKSPVAPDSPAAGACDDGFEDVGIVDDYVVCRRCLGRWFR